MAGCCEDKSCEISAMRTTHGRILWLVLLLNAVMFVVEGVAGLHANSTALLADALDMLGDTLVYGFSLFVLTRSARWQAGAAFVKGLFMLLFGLGVLGEALSKIFAPVMPEAATMGVIGGLALMANLACFFLLYQHRSVNLNMRSTWLCSRNDLVANVGVLGAAAGSAFLQSSWPDIGIGTLIASVFLHSAWRIVQQARQAMRQPLDTLSVLDGERYPLGHHGPWPVL